MLLLDILYIYLLEVKIMDSSGNTCKTCCFLGHREIEETDVLKTQVKSILGELIEKNQVDTFLFGSKSQFIRLCYDVVTELQKENPYIKRIYVRAEYPVISDSYKSYLLENYEATDYPAEVLGAGKAVYIKRNEAMIQRSQFCMIYFKEGYTPKGRKSGTMIAWDYAVKHKKTIFRFPV